MNKQKMTLEEVRNILNEDNRILRSLNGFKGHAIAKAIKKDLIELDAVTFLYERMDDWNIRNYIWRILNFSVKDAAICGLMKSAHYIHGELDELFGYSNGIGFKTGLEFAEYVKEKFNVDLTVQPTGQFKNDNGTYEDFRAFAMAFTEYFGPCHLLKRDNKNAVENRAFYKDAFLYLVRLSQYRVVLSRITGGKENLCKLETCLTEALLGKIEYMGVINYPILKELLEKEIKEESARIDILMVAVNSGYYTIGSTRNPFDSFEDFLKVVKDIKEMQGLDKFPFAVDRNSFISTGFIDNLLRLGINMDNRGCSQERKIRLTEEQKAALFTEIYEPMLYNEYVMQRLSRDPHSALLFAQSILNTAPLTEKDNIYRYMTGLGLALKKAVVKLCSLPSLNFYPTELMTEQLLAYNVDWSSMAIPKEKLYDLEYIDNIVKRIGCAGILFGTIYDKNEFAIRAINPSKLPKEFYDKYGSDISWDVVCYCKNLEISFIKEHKEKMVFRTLGRKVTELIDDELAEWLLNYRETPSCRDEDDRDFMTRQRRRIAMSAGSLSAGFIARNLDKLGIAEVTFEGTRVLKTKTPDITLKILLKELS